MDRAPPPAGPTRPLVDRRTVGRGALWSLAGTGAGQGVALLTFLVTARYVSKESFGVMALSFGIVELLRRTGVESFSAGVAARVDARREDYDACFALTSATAVAMVASVLLAAWAAAGLGAPAPFVESMRLSAALLLSGGLWRTHEAWLSRHMHFRALALRSIAGAAFGAVVGVGMAVAGFDLWSLVGQQLATNGLSLVLLWATTPWRPRLRVPGAALRRSLADARHLALSALGSFFSTETDIIVASIMLGIAPAGVYNAAKRLTLAMHLLLTSSIQGVTLSTFANMPEAPARRRAALRAMGIVAAVTLPAALGLAALAHDAVEVLLGAKWIAAAPVLSALAVNIATVSMTQFDTTIFMVEGRLSRVTRYAALSSLLNVAVLPLCALGGETALALGMSAVGLAVYPLATRSALEIAGIPPGAFRDAVGRPFLAAAAMAGLLAAAHAATPLHGLPALALFVPAGALVYAALLAALSPALIAEIVGLGGSVLGRRGAAVG